MLEARSQLAIIGWRAAAADSADAGRLQEMMAVLDEASRPLVRVHAEGYQQDSDCMMRWMGWVLLDCERRRWVSTIDYLVGVARLFGTDVEVATTKSLLCGQGECLCLLCDIEEDCYR